MNEYYGQTIQEVKKVDRQAALFLAKKLPLLSMRSKTPIINHSTPSDASVWSALHWSSTRQGVDYWYDIAMKVGL